MTSCDAYQPQTERQRKILIILFISQGVFYFFALLLPLLHNIYFYILKQKRYNVVTLTIFYIFALIDVIFCIVGDVLQTIDFAYNLNTNSIVLSGTTS